MYWSLTVAFFFQGNTQQTKTTVESEGIFTLLLARHSCIPTILISNQNQT